MVRLTDVEDAVPAIALLCSQTVIYWSVQLSLKQLDLKPGERMRQCTIRLKQVEQGEVEEAAWHLEDKAQRLALVIVSVICPSAFCPEPFGTVSKSAWTGGWLFSQANNQHQALAQRWMAAELEK